MYRLICRTGSALCLGLALGVAVAFAAATESMPPPVEQQEAAAATMENTAGENGPAAEKQDASKPAGDTAGTGVPAAGEQKELSLEERWGVRIESLRVSAAGNLLDFRYRIIDPEKAVYLVDRRNKPYIIDQASGKVFSVPTTAKVGPLRSTIRAGLPKKDRVYFILFGNPHMIKSGDRMTVVIGDDFRAENIVVE